MRILIAEDESLIRLGLKKMLQEMGHVVYAAVNGREALKMAHRHHPDLAILDIKMPFTDGLQVAKKLSRQQPMPILLLTAFSEQELIEQATDLPIHGYLIKPIKANELTAAIAIACKRFKEKQELARQNTQLAERLEGRKVIDRAKGQLMATGLSEDQAYQTLQKLARQNRITVQDAARSLLKEEPS